MTEISEMKARIKEAFTSAYKGGKGSGFFGHAGRPGKRGGSASGVNEKWVLGQGATDEFTPNVWKNVPLPRKSGGALESNYAGSLFDLSVYTDEARAKLEEDAGTVESFAMSLTGHDPNSGLDVIVDKIDFRENTSENFDDSAFEIDMKIKKDGRFAGEAIVKMDGETGDVHLELLSVVREHGNTGFGIRWYENLERQAKWNGMTSISLHANLNVGGYAWARCGFNFQDRNDRNSFQAYADSEWRQRYKGKSMPRELYKSLTTPWRIAALIGPDGYKIGKSIMLGSNWMGYKLIQEGYDDESDEGIEVGDAYFAERRTRKR